MTKTYTQGETAEFGDFSREMLSQKIETRRWQYTRGGKVARFYHVTAGFEVAGSCARWTDERWLVRQEIGDTTHGRYFLTEESAFEYFNLISVDITYTVSVVVAQAEYATLLPTIGEKMSEKFSGGHYIVDKGEESGKTYVLRFEIPEVKFDGWDDFYCGYAQALFDEAQARYIELMQED